MDDAEPITNVTASVKEEGHKILKVEKVNGYWKLIVKKLACGQDFQPVSVVRKVFYPEE